MSDEFLIDLPTFEMQQHSNQTLSWVTCDTEEGYKKHASEAPSRKLLISNGWFETPIEYKINSEGFRSAEFEPEGLVVLGCGFTFGVGMPVADLYHTYVGDELRMPVNNLGVINCSNGFMYRLARYYLPRINPKTVILQQTFERKVEVINQFNNAIVHDPEDPNSTLAKNAFGNWWANKLNGQIDRERNVMAIKYICSQLEVPLYIVTVDDFMNPVNGHGRNLIDPGPMSHQAVADLILNKIYE
jgi:hypothetical protein